MLIDGTHMGDHGGLVALGIEATGRKEVLGIIEGSADSEAVSRSLLWDLVDRGLMLERVPGCHRPP